MAQIKLDLSVEQVNAVLGSLAQMPFIQVVDLIGMIKKQAEAQVNQQDVDANVITTEPTPTQQ